METEQFTIAVIGSGFVGVTAAVVLADMGHQVTCSDRDPDRVESLRECIAPFYEPGLTEILTKAISSGNLKVTTSNVEAVAGAKIVFLCLPTPAGLNDEPDMSAVRSVVAELESIWEPGTIVVTKSTAPIGWGKELTERLKPRGVFVVSNPEFLSEGNAIRDFRFPDRVLIGSYSPEAAQVLATLHKPLNAPIIVTDCTSAELGKYVANSYLATRLSYFNEVAALCKVTEADITSVLASVGLDARIGPSFMKPGPGWGGSCLPKDTLAFTAFARSAGKPLSLVEVARTANDTQLDRCLRIIIETMQEFDLGPRLAQWGLAFKAGTDDVRYSPALTIADHLRDRGIPIQVFDPKVNGSSHGHTTSATALESCQGARLLVVATEWPQFNEIDPTEVAASGITHVIDFRNILDMDKLSAAGIHYQGLGRSIPASDQI